MNNKTWVIYWYDQYEGASEPEQIMWGASELVLAKMNALARTCYRAREFEELGNPTGRIIAWTGARWILHVGESEPPVERPPFTINQRRKLYTKNDIGDEIGD